MSRCLNVEITRIGGKIWRSLCESYYRSTFRTSQKSSESKRLFCKEKSERLFAKVIIFIINSKEKAKLNSQQSVNKNDVTTKN
jgi:hypothetical protein